MFFNLALVVYIFVIYPILLLVLAKAFPRQRQSVGGMSSPAISVVIAAHNEEKNIAQRLLNIVEQDYPLERIQVVVGSDGSTDGTVAQIEGVREQLEIHGIQLTVLDLLHRAGKPNVLNQAIACCEHDILVMTDARQRFASDAISCLVANFSDPLIGAVSGELFLLDNENSDRVAGAGRYWNYEKWVRKMESLVHSTIGATGAIYALRKELYSPIDDKTLIDDVVIPMRICMQGYRVAFDNQARAFDSAPTDSGQEWVRKVRTLAGNWQLFTLQPSFFNPFKNPVFFQFMSHKILRLCLPFALLGILVSSFLSPEPLLRLFFGLQLFCYLIALVALLVPRFRQVRVPAVAYFFCILNAAIVVGLYRLLKGEQAGLWKFAYKQD